LPPAPPATAVDLEEAEEDEVVEPARATPPDLAAAAALPTALAAATRLVCGGGFAAGCELAIGARLGGGEQARGQGDGLVNFAKQHLASIGKFHLRTINKARAKPTRGWPERGIFRTHQRFLLVIN
jgi:hypothetical protein